ncbi:alpha/beta-hydrolase [Saccharata proteae CBS 121410]|uniref:Alpha/beta-hydrolase n=1 Tax=Saccharata proteae CBS 121410 TaxID=1314787 RepID=A0A9P4HWH7_9PEZI|nr:alpha/beta-hydrolase [Saccharata proteae CBS 121410]
MEQNPQVEISSLGTVTGRLNERAIETFLGIPYASVNKRWARPEKLSSFPGGRHDGTVYGPVCPQLPNGLTEFTVPGHPPDPKVPSDEFKCLNLNVVRPGNVSGKLPVMVWIHGGAFTIGSNAETVYNGLDLVAKSVEIGEPIIHVAINYRLGYFGFLASDELLRESGNIGVGNYGLTP